MGYFWLAVVAVMAAGSGALQWLGPPRAGHNEPKREARAPEPHPAAEVTHAAIAPRAAPPLTFAVHAPTGQIADPDAALLEPMSEGAGEAKEFLPRIAADGRAPMRVYAAGFDASVRRPRVGVLLAGLGLNEAESDAAIRALPGAVSVAISPYAVNLAPLLAAARSGGHETLIAVPLEPLGFPLNDPGPGTLLTSLSTLANEQNLRWVLSRMEGYVGAVGVIGTMRGERLAAMTDQMDAMLAGLASRGLLYVDPREDHGPVAKAWGRHVEVVVDDPADRDVADRAMIEARLAALEQSARDNGSALGLVMRPTPIAVARIAAWANGLADRGLTLAPVSALALPPADQALKITEREK